MARKSIHVTDTELAVLQVLWQAGATTAREIAEMLYPECSASDMATVHSMLKRLELKKAVRRDRSTHPHGFAAIVTEAELAGHELDAMAKKLSGGSLAPLILHLLDAQRLSQTEVDEIRSMLKNYKSNRS